MNGELKCSEKRIGPVEAPSVEVEEEEEERV